MHRPYPKWLALTCLATAAVSMLAACNDYEADPVEIRATSNRADMVSGQTLKVVATDAGSVRDFQAFTKQTGNELLEQQTVGDEYIHVMRRR